MSALKICPQCGTEYPANARFCEIDGTALRSGTAGNDLVGSIVAERYHVLKKLGEGGMGQVYLAEHVKMGRKSALKVMHPGMVKDVDAISRFNREASNAARISHPNVAAIYDFGETPEGIIYLAMEFVDGLPLTKLIEQAGSLPSVRVADIVRQAADALAVAHDMGIVHRDLKPDNIMVAKTRDGGDLVKVVDFGIAKAANNEAQKVTKTGLVVGTPEYMSPEQLAGDQLDGRSDIYSLALVAFNMLTGKLPFPAESAQESMIMRLTDRPKALGEMRPDVAWPADVQAVMDRALERDATRRYQAATEFGRDLHRAISAMPETASAAMGTEVIGIPPTRVAPPRPSAAPELPPATRASVPETVAPSRAAAAPAAAMPTAPPPRKLSVPVVAGGATIIIAIATITIMSQNGKGAKADSSKTAAAATQQSGASAPNTNPSSNPADSTPRTAAPPTNFSAPVAAPPVATIDFDQLDKLAKDSATADRALREVALMSRRSAEDSVRVAFVTFKARLTLLREDACEPLKDVASIAPRTTKKDIVAKNLRGCS